MNIFVLDRSPINAARMQCDKHVVKMSLETTQLLSTAAHVHGGTAPYKPTHRNHPCSIWARASRSNWLWLFDHGRALVDEYERRYRKVHACAKFYKNVYGLLDLPSTVEHGELTAPPMCMPDVYKATTIADPWDAVVASYRAYYRSPEKRAFARWSFDWPPAWFDQ